MAQISRRDRAAGSAPAAGRRGARKRAADLTSPRARWTAMAVMAGVLLSALDQSILSTALPSIVGDIGGLDKESWLVTAYVLAATVGTALWGKVSDLYGPRAVYQAAVVTFLAGSVLAGLSRNIEELILARGVQGAGGGGLLSIALIVIGRVVPPGERGRFGGYFGAVFGVAGAAGPLVGGWLAGGPGWRWIFYVNVPIGVASVVAVTVLLRIPVERREHRIDYPGAGTVIVSVTSLLLYLDWRSTDFGWGDPLGLLLAAVSLVLVPVFVRIELRAAEPILPMHLFRNRTFSLGSLFGFLTTGVSLGILTYVPTYLQKVVGISPAQSGLAVSPLALGLFVMSLVSGRSISRSGTYKRFPVLGAVTLFAALLLLANASAATSLRWILLYEAMIGVGLGMSFQSVTTAVQNSVEPADLGVATSSVLFSRQMGGPICSAVLGAVFSGRLVHFLSRLPGGARAASPGGPAAARTLAGPLGTQIRQAYASAFGDLFLAALPLVLAALATALLLKENPPPAPATAAPPVVPPPEPGPPGPGPGAAGPAGTP